MERPTMAKETSERISAWILEFLIRNPDTEELAKRALAVLPIPAGDTRLKRTVLLRTIECEVSDAALTEATLEALELIAGLDGPASVGSAMRAAYRAVAVECTVRLLVGAGGQPSAKYLGVVDRIWRVRVERLEKRSGLLTSDLRRWRDEVEAAVWDSVASARLAAMNTRNDAVAAVRAYLKEGWALMGKLAIGWGVRLRVEQEKGVRPSREPPDRRTSLGGVIVMSKKAGLLGLSRGGDQVSDNVVGDDVDLPDSPAVLVANDKPASNFRELDGKIVVGRNKHFARCRRLRGPVRISDIEEDSDTNPSNQIYESLPTPQVNKVREALKSSSLELRMAVTDPLPAALQTAGTVVSDLATKNVVRELPLVNQNVREAGETSTFVDKNAEPVVSKDANPRSPSCSQQNDVTPCSLMDRNSTAHTLEWDDSIDGSREPKRYVKSWLHLPISKKRIVSPLEEYKPTKVSKRRTVKRWALLEEDALRTGVEKFGKGNWKLILNSYRQVFDERTEVDLKDKWRNMTK